MSRKGIPSGSKIIRRAKPYPKVTFKEMREKLIAAEKRLNKGEDIGYLFNPPIIRRRK